LAASAIIEPTFRPELSRDRGTGDRERERERELASGHCGAVLRGCQREGKKAGAVRALSLCTAGLEIMERTIIIIIITTVDSPVLNHVRGQNFSCCSYSTLSLSPTYFTYLLSMWS
jgi:hypothetical protein